MKTKKLLSGFFLALFALIANGQVKYVHSTFGNNPKTEINICWVTADTTDTSSYVLYGETTSYGLKSYNQRELIVLTDEKDEHRKNLVHHIKLTGLKPGIKYHYKCGGDKGLSGDCTFKTAPDGNAPFTFAIIGDTQIDTITKPYDHRPSLQNNEDCANFLKEQDVNFVISLGDQVGWNNLTLWDTLFDRGKSMFENMVFLPNMAGHDITNGQFTPSATRNYKSFFHLPFNGYTAFANDWYSFEYSNCVFANMNNFYDMKPHTPVISDLQHSWMDSVYDNSAKTWKFAVWHVPPVTSPNEDTLYYSFDEFLSKMKLNKVAAVLSAHTHGYLFTHPIDSAIGGKPITVNKATVTGSHPFGRKATANLSQGTIYYTGEAVCGGSGGTGPFPSYMVNTDTAGYGSWLITLATVYNDSIVYKVVLYRNGYHYPTYKKGDVYFTYKVINDTPGKKFTLVTTSAGNGTTDPTGAVQYNANENASITAIPDGGYLFDNWTGDVPVGKENDNPVVVKLDTNKAVVAHFKTAPAHSLTVNGGNGSGSYSEGYKVSISADAPETGKVFYKWTGDITGIANINVSSTTIIMPASDAVITATYKDITNAVAAEKSIVSIYPNPATEIINVLSSLPIEEIKIVDLMGKNIMIENLAGKNSITLSLTQLERGMYIIDIKLMEGIAIQKTFIAR